LFASDDSTEVDIIWKSNTASSTCLCCHVRLA